jgi:cell division protein FtsL
MYSVEGLQNGIKQCRANIRTLEEAIDREQKTIADYRIMIDDIERADELKAQAEAGVHIEIVRDDSE